MLKITLGERGLHAPIIVQVVVTHLRLRCWRFPQGPPASPSLGDGHSQQQGPPSGHRLLRCQQCSYVTSHHGHLKRHQRTHTGERPHQCSHCSKAFVQKRSLDIHLHVHTGERPFHCHLCPMDFTQKNNLVRHLRTHTGERPFCCRFCPEVFQYRHQLKMHEWKAHRHGKEERGRGPVTPS
ncbi:uncharacterized protein LOC144145887 [Haemaphysalis longicornis]